MIVLLIMLHSSGNDVMRRVVVAVILTALAVGVGLCGYRIAREVWLTQHFQAAEAALAKQDFERALQELELCLEARPDWLLARFRAARAARRDGNFEKAELHLARCEEA